VVYKSIVLLFIFYVSSSPKGLRNDFLRLFYVDFSRLISDAP